MVSLTNISKFVSQWFTSLALSFSIESLHSSLWLNVHVSTADYTLIIAYSVYTGFEIQLSQLVLFPYAHQSLLVNCLWLDIIIGQVSRVHVQFEIKSIPRSPCGNCWCRGRWIGEARVPHRYLLYYKDWGWHARYFQKTLVGLGNIIF